MKPEKDEFEYYKSVDGDNLLPETPVVNSKIASSIRINKIERKISTPCISLSQPVTTSRQNRINSLPFVRHLSHPATNRIISKI